MPILRLTSQDKTNSSATSSVAATYAASPTPNNLLIACVYSSVQTSTVGITGWITAVGSNNSSSLISSTVLIRVAQPGDSATVTATSTGSGSMHLCIFEYSGFSGVPQASIVDVSNANNSGNPTVNSLSSGNTPNTNQAEELLIAAFGFGGSGSAPSYTNSFNATKNTTRMMVADKIVSATGIYETTCTVTGTAARMMVGIVALKDALPPPSSAFFPFM